SGKSRSAATRPSYRAGCERRRISSRTVRDERKPSTTGDPQRLPYVGGKTHSCDSPVRKNHCSFFERDRLAASYGHISHLIYFRIPCETADSNQYHLVERWQHRQR